MLSFYADILIRARDALALHLEPRITIYSYARKVGEKLSQHKLITELLARSQSDVWRQAQREWEFVTIYRGSR